MADKQQSTRAHGAGERIRRSVRSTVPTAVRSAIGNIPLLGSALVPLTTQAGRVAARDFYDGLVGSPQGGPRVPVRQEPAKQDPVAEARAIGRAAGPQDTITPYDRQLAFLDTVFQSPLTMREATAYSGMLPARDIKTPKANDVVLGEAAAVSRTIYQDQINQATELAKTDPKGAQAIVEKATASYRDQLAGLAGFNPVQLAQAALLSGAGEED